MIKTEKLAVFAHLNRHWALCGLLSLSQEGTHTQGSTFAYGTRYVDRTHALEIDPVALGLIRNPAIGQRSRFTCPHGQGRKVGDCTAMLIQRFDRYWNLPDAPPVHAGADTLALANPTGGRIEKRLAFVSGLTLLACHEADSPRKTYGDLAEAIRKYGHPECVMADNQDLYRRMIYNIFVSNNDDHLRNHGFVWDPKLLGWRLSPCTT